jgi:hypothetical protein
VGLGLGPLESVMLGAGHALEEIETLERAGRAFGIADRRR